MTDSSMIATQLFDPRTGTAYDTDATRLLVMPDDPVESFEDAVDPTFPDMVIPPAPEVVPAISPKTWWLIAVATAVILTLLFGATKAALANPSSRTAAPPVLQPTIPLVVAAPPPEPPHTVVLPAADGTHGVTPSQAADAYLAGRWCEARPLYDALARENPGDPTYPAIVRVLRRSCPE